MGFRVEAVVYFWLALGFLILPLPWLVAAVVAAVFHELCHYWMAKRLRIQVFNVSVGIGGMVMELGHIPANKEFTISVAGPLGSIFLGVLLRWFPELAVCGITQGLFNLLPIYPLDGGRLVYCLFPKCGKWIEMSFIVGILVFSILFSVLYGIYPVLFAILITIKALQRKFPCNEGKIAVQ